METSRSDGKPIRLSPSRSGTSTTHGHELYWEIHGASEGPYVTLLHHGLGSIRSWRRQVPALIEAGWSVLVHDRWGYGRSASRPGFEPNFLEHDARDAVSLLEALGIERTALVGHSDGGSIATLLADDIDISSMVLVAAHIYVEPKMRAGLNLIREDAARPPFQTALHKDHGERAESLVSEWLKYWGGIEEFDIRSRLAKISCPTLVIQGELDEHATPQHARDIAHGIAGADLWLIPEVGHMPPHEIPEEFNRRILDFLEGHP